jgi:CRP-like cAMP-binding protein/chromosome segregation ATPase
MAAQKSNNDLIRLKNLVPLNTLTDVQLAHLQNQVRVERAKKGDFLFREGDTDHHNIYLLSGVIGLLSGRKEVDEVASGTETARFALAHQLPRKHSARAKCSVSFVRIDSRTLSDLLARNQHASYEVNETGDSSKGDWMGQLLQSPIFQQIPPANLQRVMMSMSEISVSAEEVIIQQGDEGDYFYLISSGQCRVTRQSGPDQPAVELAVLSAGQGFGEEALLSDKPRSSTVTMLADGELVRLSKQDFVELVKRPVSNHIDYAQACQMLQENALWIDVRTPEEYETAHLPNAINLPYFSLRFHTTNLAEDHVYLIYGDDAGQTATAAYLLLERGYEVLVVEQEWREIASQVGLQAPEGAQSQDPAIELSPVPAEGDEADSLPSDQQSDLQQQQTDTIEVSSAKLSQFQDEQKRLKQALAAAKHKLELVEQEASKRQDEQDQELDRLREKLAAAQAELVRIRQASDSAQEEYQHQLADAREHQDRQAQELVALREKYEQTQQKSATLDREHRELQQAHEELLGRVTALQELKATTMAEQEEQRCGLEQALERANVETQEVQQALAASQQELEALEAQCTQLQAQCNQEHQTAEFFRRSLETAENAVEISDGEVEENNREITRLNRQVHDLQSELAGVQADKSEMEQGRQAAVQQLRDEMDRLRQDLDQAVAERRKEGERLQTEKAGLATELAQLQAALQDKQQAFDASSAEQQQRIDQLENELRAAGTESERAAKAQAELEEREIALQQAQEEISRLTQVVEGLREVQLEMESQLSEDSAVELEQLRCALENEEKKRRHAETSAKQVDVLRRERAVQETAVEMLGEDIENLTQENTRLTEEKRLLEQEISELRSVTETHVAQLQGDHTVDANAEIQALRSELEQVRKRAEEDLSQLRNQLSVADTKVRQQDERDVDTVATVQALRQEVDSSQRALSDKEQALRTSQSQCRSLEDAIEDRDREIDYLRRKLESLLHKTSGVA